MEKDSYFELPQLRPYFMENREERRVIHQFNDKGLEVDIENIKAKYLLNEIR